MRGYERREEFLGLLRLEFKRERNSGFALLRKIPSASIAQFIDYYCSLNSADADSLGEALAEVALGTFFPYEAKHPAQTGNLAYQRLLNAPIGWRERWKYESVRTLRSYIAFAKTEPNLLSIPEDVRRRIENIRPVKSAEIRKVVKLALAQVMSSLTVTHVGGSWTYVGNLQGRRIVVNIDYDQKYSQLAYGIEHPYQGTESGVFKIDLSYEGLLGFGRGNWDNLEQTNLDQSIALLRDLVVRCEDFLKILPNFNGDSGDLPPQLRV